MSSHLSLFPHPIGILFLLGFLCAGSQVAVAASSETHLREKAMKCIRLAMEYEANPAVRAQGIEAAGTAPGDLLPMIRERLKDSHPAVRFAACLELGKIQDRPSMKAIRALLADADSSVRVGAFFALEKLGDASYRPQWADALLHAAEPAVRRNAALALGQLEDKKAAAMLRRAADQDKDEGVRIQALEGLAALGDAQAIDYFIRDAFGGRGYLQPFALLALGRGKDEKSMSTLRARFANSPYLEAKLAAARSLGKRGNRMGYDLAIASLSWDAPQKDIGDDPPENQIMRVRTMAAMALGEIGDPQALAALKSRMETPDDPRVQLAAARAILMILDRQEKAS